MANSLHNADRYGDHNNYIDDIDDVDDADADVGGTDRV